LSVDCSTREKGSPPARRSSPPIAEIVRRATGVSVAHHVQTLIAEPLDVDMWMGLPEQLISRVVPGLWEATSPMEPTQEEAVPSSYAALRQQFLRAEPHELGSRHPSQRG
jgi:CubicO group peptidase (beta-lactamase class C family)